MRYGLIRDAAKRGWPLFQPRTFSTTKCKVSRDCCKIVFFILSLSIDIFYRLRSSCVEVLVEQIERLNSTYVLFASLNLSDDPFCF